MFTGLIRNKALVMEVYSVPGGRKLELLLDSDSKVKIGSSICVSGVCLTITGKCCCVVEVEIWDDALCNSTLCNVAKFEVLNIEFPLTLSSPLDGHLISGNIKCCIVLTKTIKLGLATQFTFDCPQWAIECLDMEDNVSIDGVSLTISDMHETFIDVLIIQHSLLNTTFKFWSLGREFNLE
ncbi:MAG: hypothetical protein ACKER6_00415 [Candidatus Hodgkinia cicadicola]